VLLCDTCLTKYLQMGPAKEEAERLKARRKKSDAARLRARQAAEEAEDEDAAGAGAEAGSGVGQVAGLKPLPTAVGPAGRKGSRVSEKAKGGARGGKQRQKRRQYGGLPQESTAAEVAAAQGLADLSAEEKRSMARAMTGEAVRWAVFLQEITSAEAGRQDATEFRRHRLPGIRRLGPPLTPLPDLRTRLEWQLLGLSPTAAVQEKRRGHSHMRAKPQNKRGAQFAGSYGSQDMEGAMDVEITVAKEVEQLPGIQGTAATAREQATATAAARRGTAHHSTADFR
jgi:hypothetical protein